MKLQRWRGGRGKNSKEPFSAGQADTDESVRTQCILKGLDKQIPVHCCQEWTWLAQSYRVYQVGAEEIAGTQQSPLSK